MRNWDITKLLGAMMVITTVMRIALASILLWAFQETDTPILRLLLWSIGVSMIMYALWRVHKMREFLKFDKTFRNKE